SRVPLFRSFPYTTLFRSGPPRREGSVAAELRADPGGALVAGLDRVSGCPALAQPRPGGRVADHRGPDPPCEGYLDESGEAEGADARAAGRGRPRYREGLGLPA